MKPKLLLLTIAAVFLTGCGTLLHKGEPQTVTVTQPIYSVDASTGLITQVGTTNIEATATPYQVNSNLLAGVAAGQMLLNTGAAIPSPASPIFAGLSIGLGAFTALLGLYAKRKSGELTTSNAALAATITAIEALDKVGEIKKMVKTTSVANGSQEYLDSKVQEVSFNSQ